MPTYEYVCQACGHRFDALQRITEAPLKDCPKCRRSQLKRLIGAGLGVIFKGSGFYTTDYKRGAAGTSSKKSKSETASEAKSESKVESKTA